MPSSEKMFQHSYRDGLQDIELNRVQNEVDLKAALSSPAPTPRAHLILLEQYNKMMRAVIESLTL
jgi:hypothetical protein